MEPETSSVAETTEAATTKTNDGATAESPFLLLVADDLMFPSRIREACRPLGYVVRVVATEAATQNALSQTENAPPLALLVNLAARRYDPLAIIRAVKADPRFAALPLLAFAGHVEADKHEAARVAGADMVAANSSVSLHLPALLSRLLRPTPNSGEASELVDEERGDNA